MAEPTSVYLETDRLVLRTFGPDDVDNLVALDSDPEVMRYINGGRPTSREKVTDTILPAYLAYARRADGYGFWAVEERETGEFIGRLNLRLDPDHPRPGEPELGYRLRREAWGRGYATEGSRALIAKAFAEVGAQRVWATTMVINAASRRVMEKAGLRYVRTFWGEWPEAIPGDEHGDVEYALTREEWLADIRGDQILHS